MSTMSPLRRLRPLVPPDRLHALHRLLHVARHHRRAADLAVAALVFAATLLTSAGGHSSGGPRPGLVGVLTAAAACGALAVRRRWPLPALVVSSAGAEIFMALSRGQTGMLVIVAPLIALYTVAESGDRRHGLAVGGLAVATIGVAHGLLKPSWVGPANLALVALGALAVAAGDSSRNRRAYLAEAEQRAARAEHEKDTDARRRVTEERLRIARDLHDSVGHHLALISVQSAVADRLLRTTPGQAHEALSHVQAASRSALEELGDTIGLLREAGEPAAPTQPTPGLHSLTELVASFRASGLKIEQDVGGKVRRLAPAANMTAYRVIQESLTNVCKHAGTPGARLRLAYEPAALTITIDDNGSPGLQRAGGAAAGGAAAGGAGAGRGGHGIIGMRERVTAVGGAFQAGPRPGGGFRVSATLPLAGVNAGFPAEYHAERTRA
jgi:signal transduction histidine kinase